MTKGDVVKIYQDPLTEKRLEGEARLIRYVGTSFGYAGNKFERWMCSFVQDSPEDRPVERLIRVDTEYQKEVRRNQR